MRRLFANGEDAQRGGDSDTEALLAAIVSSSDDAIISKTLNGIITSWNEGAERLFGYSPAEAIGQSITLIIPTERRDEENQILQRIRRGERVEHFETVRVAKNGQTLDVSLTISPVRDRHGRVVGASKVGRDISAHKRAAAEVRAAQELLRLIVDNVPALISYVDRDYRYQLNNRTYETWFGDASSNLAGKYVSDVLGAAAFEKVRLRMAAALAGQHVTFDDHIPYRNAGARWINGNYIPHVAEDGSVKGFAVLVHDVSERQQAEDARRFLMAVHDDTRGLRDPGEVMLRTVTQVGSRFRVTRCAYGEVEEGERHLLITRGYTDGVPTVAGRHPLESFGRSLIAQLKTGHTAAISDVRSDALTNDSTALTTYEAMQIRSMICAPIVKAGRLLAVLVMADGTPRQWAAHDVALLQQVAERTFFAVESARANAALMESRDELQRLNADLSEVDRRKDEFLAVLAHELRNPLAPIMNATQYLRLKGPAEPGLQNARDIIDRQVRQLVRLVDDLLDVSRISSGKISLRRERISLAWIVTNAVESSRPLIESENHQLTVTLPPQPVYLDADLTRLAQVLQNLLNNAAKYTMPGGKIGLHAEFDGKFVAIRVVDSGIGIPHDMLARVFDLFTQVDRSIERATGGLGIGLTLVQRLVELHGGTVAARSEGAGKGSEFTVRLPAFAESSADAAATRKRDLTSSGRLRIVIVDDNVDAADTLAEVLAASGHDVNTAYDGVGALGAFDSHRPDVVLLDIGLPRMNGYDVARKIRASDPQGSVVLVAVTGWGQEEDRRRSQEAGFNHHLVKPVDPASLASILARVTPTKPGVAARN
jgi:PAS domain S-box-containing protein